MERQIFSRSEIVPDETRHEHLGMIKAMADPTMMSETLKNGVCSAPRKLDRCIMEG
jgi:hypothetical protein